MIQLRGNEVLYRISKHCSAFVAAAFLLVLAGCNTQPAPDTKAAEAAVRKADADWVKAAQGKKAEDWMAFYSDDVVILPPNDKTSNGKDAARKPVAELLATPGLVISWQPTKVEVANSGDVAYLYGTYQMTTNGPDGKPMTDNGKMLEIWKKQADGSWKCALDTWNTDLPAAPTAPAPAASK